MLSKKYLSRYPDFPAHMNALGRFVYLRTYSRFLPDEKRRETWKETCERSVNYNVGLAKKHYEKLGLPIPQKELVEEAESLFHSMFNLGQFLSGRTMWIGGGENGVADKYPLANFNCSFLNITRWEDLCEVFYLLLVGTGVGFKCTKRMAAQLPPIKTEFTLIHSEYKPLPTTARLEHTELHILENGYAKIYVGDSKEGWVEALRYFLHLLTDEQYSAIHTIKISYNSVRPAGERLKTFGGTASGHAPLMEMFEGFEKVLKNTLDPYLDPIVDGKVRPIHILDMGNFIGYNVVVGGVRRTAEIFLFDEDDWECLMAKYGINGIWTEEQLERHDAIAEKLDGLGVLPKWMDEIATIGAGRSYLNHRRMSNNSIIFKNKPEKDFLQLVFDVMQMEGEPGFVNLRELAQRRFDQLNIDKPTDEMMDEMMDSIGMNPCAEIILHTYGVCNLTTVNVMNFVNNGQLDFERLAAAQKLSARAGLRMTLVELEIAHWSETQKRDRLLGCSLTGWKDAIEALGYSEEKERLLLQKLGSLARDEADRYAKKMRVPTPLLVTTIKPEGTLSQVAGGVSSGLHVSHSPYYIRRIRINAQDPLAQAVRDLGWTINPEIGTPGESYDEQLKNARTWVIDFPVKSYATKTKNETSVEEQFATYFTFQANYTEHNSSNTITLKPEEWDKALEIVWQNWDRFAAVSFLALDGGTYKLAPYEACTEEQYQSLLQSMPELTIEQLQKFDRLRAEPEDDAGDESCESGVCPIR